MIPLNRPIACLSHDGRVFTLLILTRCKDTPAWQVLVTGEGNPATWF